MIEEERCVIIDPRDTADASVIWLHGLGADGHDFEPIVPMLGKAVTRRTRFVFPHAPFRPVTINAGFVMRAWYDILELDLGRQPDVEGIRDSSAILVEFVRGECERGIDPRRVVVAGFSQGGVIALHTGLRHPQTLAGIMALSAYLPASDHVSIEASDANARTPIFMAHGEQDPVVPVAIAAASRDRLDAEGYRIEWHQYSMPHGVCEEEIRDIAAWLSMLLDDD